PAPHAPPLPIIARLGLYPVHPQFGPPGLLLVRGRYPRGEERLEELGPFLVGVVERPDLAERRPQGRAEFLRALLIAEQQRQDDLARAALHPTTPPGAMGRVSADPDRGVGVRDGLDPDRLNARALG